MGSGIGRPGAIAAFAYNYTAIVNVEFDPAKIS